MSGEWLTSAEAARRLGVSAATLYAYVSRGLVRSEGKAGHRERRYLAGDVAQLKRRREVGRKAESIAANALDFGTPVLESSLTLIERGHLHYRGRDATQLARHASLEQVAELLWNCDARPFGAKNLPAMTTVLRQAWQATSGLAAIEACLILLPAAARWDHPAWVEDRSAMLETGGRILRLLTAAVTGHALSAQPIHEQLAAAWGVAADQGHLLRAALVLSADHEFNASTFAARVVASTGANLYASTLAGLAAINGPRHGGATRRVAAWLDDPSCEPAGFGHPLYPDGDVRAQTLLAMLRAAQPGSQRLAEAERLAAGRQPNIDFATVVLERVLELPKDSALSLFLLGRAVGWIGHALEQAELGGLIRPRARYVGPRP